MNTLIGRKLTKKAARAEFEADRCVVFHLGNPDGVSARIIRKLNDSGTFEDVVKQYTRVFGRPEFCRQ